jgi:hypothetical protein
VPPPDADIVEENLGEHRHQQHATCDNKAHPLTPHCWLQYLGRSSPSLSSSQTGWGRHGGCCWAQLGA